MADEVAMDGDRPWPGALAGRSSLTRRRFLGASAGLVGGLGAVRSAEALAQTGFTELQPRMVDGVAHYHLVVAYSPIEIGGRPTRAITVNGTMPGPQLRLVEGQEVVLRVTNQLDEDTSIHWHGVLVPPIMDGVPGVSFPGIVAGATFEYRFPLKQYGTYWYHSHSGLQEQIGHRGSLVIEPAEGYPFAFDRELTIMLADWTFQDPEWVLSRLKKQPNFFNRQRLTLVDFLRGAPPSFGERLMWARMRMDPTDILDVTGATYTYLANGMAPMTPWTGLFRPGERVLVRFINASAATYFDVRIPGLPITMVEADGQFIEPVVVDEFRMAVAETYAVLIEPGDQAYPVFAETMDRSGYALGVLAPREGMRVEVPPRRERPLLTMADMGMAHGDGHEMGGHEMEQAPADAHTGHAPQATEPVEGHDEHGTAPATAEEHAGHQPPPEPAETHAGHVEPDPSEDDVQAEPTVPAYEHADHPSSSEPTDAEQAYDRPMESAAEPAEGSGELMDHDAHAAGPATSTSRVAVAGAIRTTGLRPPGTIPETIPHEEDSHGPGNAMVPDMVRSRLHEPGVGLGNDGWRVLTYADVRSLHPEPRRAPEREIELHLTGNMERFMWSINGVPFEDSDLIPFEYGERIRLTMVNDTMMNHPMHLHGMWMELENGQGEHIPRMHTVNVQPAEHLSVLITADAPGMWAFHCHILYHMDVGMFRVVLVSEPGEPAAPPMPIPEVVPEHEGHDD